MSCLISQKIVEQARSWLGTDFCHLGRTKKTSESSGGCDCLGLFMGVASELNLQDKFGNPVTDLDETTYSLVPDGDYVKSKLKQYFIEKNNISLGNLVLLSFINNPQHLAIVATSNYDGVERFTLIHAYFSLGKVCEHLLDQKWQERVVAIFSLTSNINKL
jgi:cell wall-associated NlpC family hydrolase